MDAWRDYDDYGICINCFIILYSLLKKGQWKGAQHLKAVLLPFCPSQFCSAAFDLLAPISIDFSAEGPSLSAGFGRRIGSKLVKLRANETLHCVKQEGKLRWTSGWE